MPPLRHSRLAQSLRAYKRRCRFLRAEVLEPRLALAAEIEPNDSLALATPFGTGNETHTGRLSSLGDRDYFQVVLGQGDRLTANYSKPSTFDPEVIGAVEILDDAGRVLATKVTNLQAEALVPKAGTYYVRTSPENEYGTFTGNYVLGTSVSVFSGTIESEPNDTSGTATATSSGTNFRGTLSTASDLDYFSFTGSVGQVVSIKLTNIPADSPTVIVYRPNGTELGRGDVGMGVQLGLPDAGSYRFAISAVRSVGTFTGEYVGRMSLASTPVTIPAAGTGFDSAVGVTLGSSSVAVVGTLTDVNVPRYLYFDVTTLSHSSVSFSSLPYNVRATLYNDRGQILDYRHGGSVSTTSVDFAFTAGRYFVSLQALSETGLGPFQMSVARSTTLSPQRDVPLYFIDLTAQKTHLSYPWVAPFGVPAASGYIQGLMESRYDSWDVDVTQTMPVAGTEHVGGGYGDFGNIGAGGWGGGGFGTRRPSGDSVSSCVITTWTSINYGCVSTLNHELGHATGLLHARSVQGVMGYVNDDELFPVGSGYLFPGTDSFVPSTYQNNPRDYLDWALQAGRQIIEAEPNDTPAAAVNLESYFNEMRAETIAGTSVPTGTGTRPTDLRLANLNADAWPDLVVAHDSTETLTVHLGTGLATFDTGTSYTPGFNLDWFRTNLAVGDINGDGRDDVFVVGGSITTNNVAIYLSNADGTLAAPTFVTGGSFPERITLADLNNDTQLDLITGSSSQVGIHLGNGNGTFQSRTTYTTGGSGVRDLVIANVNGDAHLDVITANYGGDNVSILRGNGNGTLQAHVSYAVGDGPMAVMLQELTGDSNPDLLTINNNSQTFSILPGTGGGAFGTASSQPGLPDMYSLNKGDFNLDGKVDIIVSTNTGAHFYTANASGTLVEFSALQSTLNKAVAVADLNQDGGDDVLWSNYWNTRVDVLLTKPNDVRNDRTVVFGRISSATDEDRYTFAAAAGQRFAIDVEAAEFQYPLDAVVTIFDSNGNLIVQSDDALDRDTGITSVDPYLLHTFVAAGTYHVRVTSKLGTVGHYRLKVTPGEAIDDDGPKVIGTWSPANGAVGRSRRQIIFYLNDQLDPATLTAANIVVQGTTAGVRAGTVVFDPLESVLIWTADASLPIDSYTVTLAGGANGITDLKGNLLDGETDGTFAFPEVSGNGTPGGNFSLSFSVSTNDTTAATISASYSRGPYNRGRFLLSASDELSLAQVAGAQLTARGAGPDATFNTADDRILPLDVLQDNMNHRNTIYAYTRGIPDPDQYRLEGSIRDAAGLTINLSHVVNIAAEVPESALFTAADLQQTGLVGSYVNSSLRAYATQDDWRVSQTIVGTRTDPTIDFLTGDFGTRAQVGVTGGTDANWDNFSTQWDGYLQVPAAGTRLLLRSTHGSRMWIDLNNDGLFGSSGAEYVTNFWGSTGSTTGTLSTAIPTAGTYRIRVQYEHATGSEQAFLEWLTPDYAGRTEGIGHGPSVIDSSLQTGSAVMAAGLDSLSVVFSGAINPATLTTANFKIRYSADGRFFDGNDTLLTESDGLIAWNAVERRATFQALQPFARGQYLLELNGDAGGIAATNGELLDGEYLDSYIAGNALPMHWQDTPSGDGVAGGDYLATFTISNFTATVASAGNVVEDSGTPLVFQFTRTGDITAAGTVNFDVSGAATFGSDYTQTGAATFTATAGTVTFAAGAAVATVTINVTAETFFEADETVILTLTAGSSYFVGAPAAGTGTIQNDDSPLFLALNYSQTSTGVIVNFNRPLNTALLNLYDIQGDVFGAADLTLVGTTHGNVRGSLVVDPNLQRVTFVATAGRLPPDNYTLTLRGTSDSFQDVPGQVLDGDANGSAGGNYVRTFVVTAPAANVVTVSTENFARGPEQAVNLPATGSSGLPISFSDGGGITSATFELRYNPALLTITAASVAAGLPVGATVNLNTSTPGVASLQFSSPTPLAAGTTRFVNLQATVPSTALYRTKHVLDLTNISLNAGAIPALDDDALHVVAFFADVTGNGTYSAQDASFIARQAVGIDTGFDQFKLLDPFIIGDITGNGGISAQDTSFMLQAAVGINVAEIPTPLPTVSLTQGGPDPKLSIPQNLVAAAGGLLTIPVEIDSIVNLTGNGLASADLVIYYDPNVLEVTAATLGRLIAQRGWLISSQINTLAGRINISLAGTRPLEGQFVGELVQLQATVKADAVAGTSAINLAATSRSRSTQLNEGFLTLIPAPTDAANDAVDGRVLITREVASEPTPAVRQVNNHLLITGTAGDDQLVVVAAGEQVRIRLNRQLLGTFDLPSGVVIEGLTGSDQIVLVGVDRPTLVTFSDAATTDDIIFGAANTFVVDLSDESSAAEQTEIPGPDQLAAKDLALLQLLTELSHASAQSQANALRFRRR